MCLISMLDQTCTRQVACQLPDDYGDALMSVRTCGRLVPPGQMFCDECEEELRLHRTRELESDAA